jgi:hypothetical protein
MAGLRNLPARARAGGRTSTSGEQPSLLTTSRRLVVTIGAR